MKKYEIWTGYCASAQGHAPESHPTFWGVEVAISFPVACIKLELRRMLAQIQDEERIKEQVDSQSLEWFYQRNSNSNSWTGKYYETQEEAQKTFINS